jgi:hypothetical protein
LSLPARQTLRPDARRRHFFHRTRARALFKGAGGRSGGAQAVQTPARAALAPVDKSEPAGQLPAAQGPEDAETQRRPVFVRRCPTRLLRAAVPTSSGPHGAEATASRLRSLRKTTAATKIARTAGNVLQMRAMSGAGAARTSARRAARADATVARSLGPAPRAPRHHGGRSHPSDLKRRLQAGFPVTHVACAAADRSASHRRSGAQST